jgi:hypothetical protein
MKKSRSLTVLMCLCFLTLLFLAGPVRNAKAEGGTAETAVQKKSGGTNVTTGFSEEKKEFKTKTKEKVAELDGKIDELEIKAKKEGSKVKAEARKGLRELKKKRVGLKKDLRKLNAAGEKTWDAAKQKVNDAMDDLQKTYDKVLSYFDSN